jgi:hypothetical protein
MICKAVVVALSHQETDFPRVKDGERPWRSLTYFDKEVDRDPRAVTVLVDRSIPEAEYPAEYQAVTLVMQIEEVERAVTRTDRDDRSRTYESVSRQMKARVIAFEPAPQKANGAAKSATPPPAKAAA